MSISNRAVTVALLTWIFITAGLMMVVSLRSPPSKQSEFVYFALICLCSTIFSALAYYVTLKHKNGWIVMILVISFTTASLLIQSFVKATDLQIVLALSVAWLALGGGLIRWIMWLLRH